MAELASYWRLGPAVTACLAASRILFLDATRDRYLALPAEQTGAFSAWLDAPENGLADACRSSLSALAVGTDVIPRPERHQIELPAPFDARLLAPCRPDPGDIMAIGREVFRAWRDVRRLPLAAIVERRRHELAWRSPA